MAEESHLSLSQHWVTVKDEKTGLLVEFPRTPLEMTFEVPFQNTPPTGHIHLYSVPTQKGLLALSSFHCSTVDTDMLQKENLYQFFERILVPHFFFNPAVFQNHQVFHFKRIKFDSQEAVSFQFSFQDHEIEKKLEGIALIKKQTLYIPFYLASVKDFDQKILEHFLNSIQIP
jgi:hypothetical protein